MTINCRGQLLDLNRPKIMGVLNITPDSFYDGGRYKSDQSVLEQVEKMLNQGASIIDVGAYSSRPEADPVSEDEELRRITPIVKLLLKHFTNSILSIDTFRAKVAKACIETGASLINDISAGHLDPSMIETVGQLQVPYIMMHMRGTPQTMSQMTSYDHLVKDIYFYFTERLTVARKHHIKDIIIDPGFGFSKTLEQNYELLQALEHFKSLDVPILAGVSRKSMIYRVLDTTAKEALNGTTALNMMALIKGSSLLRVHDVKEAMECVMLFNQTQKQA